MLQFVTALYCTFTFLNLQNVFRGPEILKTRIFLALGNYGVGKEKLPFQKTVSPKNLWIQP